jgi:hypothetical protein
MPAAAGTKRNKQSLETQIDEFTDLVVETIDSARSKMTDQQVRDADRKTNEMISSATRTKQ